LMTISQFRTVFNERFDSSGRSPYSQGEIQQVAALVRQDSLATDPASFPDSAEIVPAQMALLPPEPREPRVARALDGSAQAAVSFQAASIPFAVGSSALNSSDRRTLKKVAKLYNKFGGIVRVIGHASRRTRDMDSDSHQWVNFQLSLDRATAVSMELARLGVPAAAVMVMARSDNEPLTYEYMPEGEADNRRADIYIEY
ncbi:MAG: OmpA family protein, partial [Alphaproteobacteria bacterium]